jgi:hypothetical protein
MDPENLPGSIVDKFDPPLIVEGDQSDRGVVDECLKVSIGDLSIHPGFFKLVVELVEILIESGELGLLPSPYEGSGHLTTQVCDEEILNLPVHLIDIPDQADHEITEKSGKNDDERIVRKIKNGKEKEEAGQCDKERPENQIQVKSPRDHIFSFYYR